MNNVILKNIKAIRIFLGLSRAQFAEAVGVSGSLITQIENEEREPSAGTLALICQAFHLKPNTIYDVDMTAELIKHDRTGRQSPKNEQDAA